MSRIGFDMTLGGGMSWRLICVWLAALNLGGCNLVLPGSPSDPDIRCSNGVDDPPGCRDEQPEWPETDCPDVEPPCPDPLESLPSCHDEIRGALPDTDEIWGFSYVPGGRYHHIPAVVSRIEPGTLTFQAADESVTFHWRGPLPFPMSVGEAAELDVGEQWDSVVTERGELRALHFQAFRYASSAELDYDLCLTQRMLCSVRMGQAAVETNVHSARESLRIGPGTSASLEGWTLINPGLMTVPTHSCDESSFGTPATVAAWRLAAPWAPPLPPDPAGCTEGIALASEPYVMNGSYGLSFRTGSTLVPALVRRVLFDKVELQIDGRDVEDTFRWVEALPIDLKPGDHVQVSQAGDGWNTLQTDSMELRVSFQQSFYVDRKARDLPEGPSVGFAHGCYVSRSSQSVSAVVSWEGREHELVPGSQDSFGPWLIRHHAGRSDPGFSCAGWNLEGFGMALTTAIRMLEEPQPEEADW